MIANGVRLKLCIKKKKKLQNPSKVCNIATFPPMAVYLPDETDLQPEDPTPQLNGASNVGDWFV